MSVIKYIWSGELLRYLSSSVRSGFEQYSLIKQLNNRFPKAKIDNQIKLVSPHLIELSEGVKIDRNCYLNAGGVNYCGKDGRIYIGKDVIVGYNCILFAGGGEIEISQYTRVGIGCIISAQSEDSFANPEVRPDNHQHIFEKVVIGKNCLIAGGAIILGGTTLGDNCIVGSGAVVKGKYPDHTTLIGNPARAIPRLPFQK